jgi:hypothetical protein
MSSIGTNVFQITLKMGFKHGRVKLIEVAKPIYQIYSRDMKLMKLGLQPQITLKPVPRGSEFAAFLVNQAGMDSVLMRGQIEDACVRDLITYFDDKKIRYTDDWLRALIKAELAGGNFAAANMPERLSRQLTELSADSIAEIAADLSVLLNTKRSDFNYFRYSLNAVSTVMGDLFKENLFDISGLKNKEKENLQTSLSEVMEQKLNDASSVMTWLDKVTNLQYQVIDLHGVDDFKKSEDGVEIAIKPSKAIQAARKSKSYVSTKSMSTYKLRVYDYALVHSKKFLKPSESVFQQEFDFEKRLRNYQNYVGLSIKEIKSLLEKSLDNKQLKEKYLLGIKTDESNSNRPIISITESLTRQRKITINYSGLSVSLRLIKPILGSLKSQLLLTPDQKTWRAEAKSGSDFLSVEIDSLRDEDLSKIEKILQLHSE